MLLKYKLCFPPKDTNLISTVNSYKRLSLIKFSHKTRVAEPHNFVCGSGTNFDAAPAPTLTYSEQNLLKTKTKDVTSFEGFFYVILCPKTI
jgi:hypothetical protein